VILQLADGVHHDPVEAVHHRGRLLDGFRIGQAQRPRTGLRRSPSSVRAPPRRRDSH
jgi:hypothetical protein